MAAPVAFRPPHPPRSTPRTLGDKLQEIGIRSPADLRAFEVLADHVLARLHEDDPTDWRLIRRPRP